MACVAVDKGGHEYVYHYKPSRGENGWDNKIMFHSEHCRLTKGSIEKLIGKKLTWKDEPVKLQRNK